MAHNPLKLYRCSRPLLWAWPKTDALYGSDLASRSAAWMDCQNWSPVSSNFSAHGSPTATPIAGFTMRSMPL